MKKLFIIILTLLIFTTTSQAQVYSTTAGGAWDQVTTWSGGVVPSVNDSVVIQGPVVLYFHSLAPHLPPARETSNS